MKSNILVLLFASILVFTQSCRKVSGDGPVVTQSYSLSGFTALSAEIDGDVYFTQDSLYSVSIEAQQNILNLIETPIVNGELRIHFEPLKHIGRHSRIIVRVAGPSITGLAVNGSGNVYVSRPVLGNYLSLKVSGSGNLSVAQFTGQSLSAIISGSGNISVNGGTVNSEDLQISGSGSMDLLNIAAQDVVSKTSGSGKITVQVSQHLNVRISGSGDVYYLGNPSVDASISGSGEVKKM